MTYSSFLVLQHFANTVLFLLNVFVCLCCYGLHLSLLSFCFVLLGQPEIVAHSPQVRCLLECLLGSILHYSPTLELFCSTMLQQHSICRRPLRYTHIGNHSSHFGLSHIHNAWESSLCSNMRVQIFPCR